jgi:hypothetical protein
MVNQHADGCVTRRLGGVATLIRARQYREIPLGGDPHCSNTRTPGAVMTSEGAFSLPISLLLITVVVMFVIGHVEVSLS